MKGNHDCHTYTAEGRENYSGIAQDYKPVGPTQEWVNRFYPDKIMTLPVGVTAGRGWVRRVG